MERKIGQTFEYEGKKLQVKESASFSCDGCFLIINAIRVIEM